MKKPASRDEITPAHIEHMLKTIEARTRATQNTAGLMMIMEHDFNVLLIYAKTAGQMMTLYAALEEKPE